MFGNNMGYNQGGNLFNATQKTNLQSVTDPRGNQHWYNPDRYQHDAWHAEPTRPFKSLIGTPYQYTPSYKSVGSGNNSQQSASTTASVGPTSAGASVGPTPGGASGGTPIDGAGWGSHGGSYSFATKPNPNDPMFGTGGGGQDQNNSGVGPAPGSSRPRDPYAAMQAQYQAQIRQQQQQQAERDRQAILARQRQSIAAARDRYATQVDAFGNQIGNAGIYDANRLDYLSGDIDRLASTLGGYSVPGGSYGYGDYAGQVNEMTASFDDLMPQLDDYRSQIGQLYSQRQTELDQLYNTIQETAGQTAQFDPWAESDYQQVLDDLYGVRGDVTRFVGDDTENISTLMDTSLEDINAALQNIYDTRSGHETQAQTLLDEARDVGGFTGIPAIDSYQSQLDSLLGDVDQWGATQAQDEIDALSALLGGERQRIETEQEKREAQRLASAEAMRQQLAANQAGAAQAMLGGGYNFRDDNYLNYDQSALMRALGVV